MNDRDKQSKGTSMATGGTIFPPAVAQFKPQPQAIRVSYQLPNSPCVGSNGWRCKTIIKYTGTNFKKNTKGKSSFSSLTWKLFNWEKRKAKLFGIDIYEIQ